MCIFYAGQDSSGTSAWGRRLFNDEEIDAREDGDGVKSRYLEQDEEEEDDEERTRTIEVCTDRDQLQQLGLWDCIYDSGIIPTFQKDKKLKPWLTNKKVCTVPFCFVFRFD
jgi:hypothetical protein